MWRVYAGRLFERSPFGTTQTPKTKGLRQPAIRKCSDNRKESPFFHFESPLFSGLKGGSHDEFAFQFVVGFAFPRGKAHGEKGPRRGYHSFQFLAVLK